MSFLAELRRRNVIRMAGLYLVAAWLLVQVGATLLPVFSAPAWALKALVIALAIGFLPALVFAWVFELTPEGFKRDAEVPAAESIAPQTARRMEHAIVVLLVLALGYFAVDKFMVAPRREATSMATAIASAVQKERKAASAIPENSIAVLPLSNESGDQGQQYFSDGLSEDLITALSQFQGLRVISRDSSFQFRGSKAGSKEIGAKLGVAHLLEGSVRRAGGVVRISAQLVNVADSSTLWSQHYDRPYKELFSLQDDITNAVTSALKTKLVHDKGHRPQSERPASGNLAAWEAWSRGAFYSKMSDIESNRKAIAAYQQAVTLDPDYAQAYSDLSGAWASLAASYLIEEAERRAAYNKARAAADTALQLDPDLAEAHVARGLLLWWSDMDIPGAEREYQRAFALAPDEPLMKFEMSFMRRVNGQARQAIALLRQYIASSPRSVNAWYWLGWNLAAIGQPEEAEQAVRAGLELQPQASSLPTALAIIQIQRGAYQSALATARQEPPGNWRTTGVAIASQLGADQASADAALQELIVRQAESSAYQIAEVYALRRDPDNMFKWLDRAWSNRDAGIGRLLTDPFILRYRDDPRFAAYCRKAGLPTTTDAKAMP